MKSAIVVCILFALLISAPITYAQTHPNQVARSAGDVLSRVTKVKGLKLVSTSALQAPRDSFCLDNLGLPCYSPQQIREAYGLTPLLNAGYTGAGQTIIIIDSFGSPTIEQDLKTF